jgi:hypothetical protein
MHWEQTYKRALIEALNPRGDVLQVGFGLGYAASEIQTYQPNSLTIIEPDPLAAATAKEWGGSHVTVIHETWQNVLPSLGTFDAIFFNQFSREKVAEVVKCREHGSAVLAQGQATLAMVEKTLPQLTIQRYTDADLNEFFQSLGAFDSQQMAVFLSQLYCNQQISQEQYEKFLLKHGLKKMEPSLTTATDPAFVFFEACLEHLRPGGRFSCFSPQPLSKYEDPDFFQHVITNPHFDYHEHTIPVSVPSSCSYYPFTEALVLVIRKSC